MSADEKAEVTPMKVADFTGLPPWIITADIDPLRDDTPLYIGRLLNSGVLACWINEPQLVHGYLRARNMSKRAADSFKRIGIILCAADTWC